MNPTTRILLAEDEPILASIIEDLLTTEGQEVVVCNDGQSAWEKLQSPEERFDVILLDRVMPGLDGLELLRRIKAEPRLDHIPVIMETGQGDKESIREGLAEGAYYYLTKPFQPEVMLAVVQAALDQFSEYLELVDELQKNERPIHFIQRAEFRYRNLDEARALANFLAQSCPDPQRVVQGFQELLVNAVEHGNLGISYDDKGTLLHEGHWQDEVMRRLGLAEYRDRHVEVRFQRNDASLEFLIHDQGVGFDWETYLDFSPERAFDLHGRGIAMARKLSFDHLEYQGNGNTVLAVILLENSKAFPNN
jgi:CheY-like chemotaxis protein